ncbi:MAG: hypothetical protein NTW49_10005 [Bacteroidia bacterium]|nr:hypothetical protein [Bacteroidia bacterium]
MYSCVKHGILIVLILLAYRSESQVKTYENHPLTVNTSSVSNYYLHIGTALTTVDDSYTVLPDVGIGMIIDQQYEFGLHIKSSSIPLTLISFGDNSVNLIEAGFDMAWIYKPENNIHPVINIFAGFGYLLFEDNTYFQTYEFNPSVMLEKNLGNHWAFDFGLGFRFNNPLSINVTNNGSQYVYISGPELKLCINYKLKK